MKRILIAFLALLIFLTFTACNSVSEIEIDESGDIVITPNGEISSISGSFTIKNNTDKEFCFGREFFIEVYKRGMWYHAYGPGDAPAEQCILSAGETMTLPENWTYGIKLAPGKYRFVKEIDGKHYAAEFEITEFKLY